MIRPSARPVMGQLAAAALLLQHLHLQKFATFCAYHFCTMSMPGLLKPAVSCSLQRRGCHWSPLQASAAPDSCPALGKLCAAASYLHQPAPAELSLPCLLLQA